jgi:ectoine hydroxylase-related dioxygenase (phytanoyl-CoA dioxygenase family)
MSTDLSKRHELVSSLFTIPQTHDAWEQYRLTDDEVKFFHENGYLPGIKILDDAQVEALRAEVADLANPKCDGHELFYEYHSNESASPETVLFHALGAWRLRPALHDILWAPAFTMAASQLLGGKVRFWHDQLFCKPPKHGGVVAWHQDYSYWTRTKPMAHLTCWIALDDATRDNGCVCYIPGSHRWPLLPITGLAGDMNAIQSVLNDEQKAQFTPVFAELKRGEAVFHHPLMVHGSYENRTERPRRAVVMNVFADGVKSDSNDELLAGVPPVAAGETMSGQFFPLLFDPAQA